MSQEIKELTDLDGTPVYSILTSPQKQCPEGILKQDGIP